MTAEIVVMNREAVVLAADSAVSVEVGSNTKISTLANKLFSLSRKHPVGIMVYGNANFMGLPWETLIKYYRDSCLPKEGFSRLKDYAEHFITYLNSSNINFSTMAERYYIGSFAYSLFQDILGEIEKEMENRVEEGEELTEKIIHEIFGSILNAYMRELKESPKVLRLNDCRKILNTHRKTITSLQKEVFHELSIDRELSSLIRTVLLYSVARRFLDSLASGIVIAGFGHDDFIPAVIACNVEGVFAIETKEGKKKILKYLIDDISENDEYDNTAVLAFAQRDMVRRFMNGVDTHFFDAATSFLGEICRDFIEKIVVRLGKYDEKERGVIKNQLNKYGEQVVEAFEKNMGEFVSKYFNAPIIRAVSRLPKSELAIMAEALVNLTSLKRKISQDPETVAEPVDVAVITKGDGFIWIKRKHYFEASLNTDYFNRLSQECLNEQ